LAADPEITSINVNGITQTSARISWSKGRTQVVNSIVVYYRATTTTTWTIISRASHNTAYTVSSLQPGTQYKFYVKIVSYGKHATSNIITVTTGMCSYYLFLSSYGWWICSYDPLTIEQLLDYQLLTDPAIESW